MKRWVMLIMLIVCGFVHAVIIRSNQTFTYQGRLYDDGSPLDGTVDFQMHLLDGSDPNTAEILAIYTAHNHPVSDGYVTLKVNFEYDPAWEKGELFDGSDRWLEIWMRDGQLEDPNDYTYLKPFVKLEATPFAHVAHRLEPPETLEADLAEPVLHVINTGSGPTIASGGDVSLYEPNVVGSGESTIRFEGSGTLLTVNNMQVSVGNDRQTTVSGDDVTFVGTSSTTDIGMTRTTAVGVNDQTTVGGSSSLNVGGALSQSAGMDMDLSAGGDMGLEAGQNMGLEALGQIRMDFEDEGQVSYGTNANIVIGGNRTTNIGGTDGRTVVSHSSETVGGNRSILVGTSETKVVQNSSAVTVTNDLSQTAGRDLVLAAGREIQTLGTIRMTDQDPNMAVFVDGVINLHPQSELPQSDPLYGTLFYHDGKLYFRDADDLFEITPDGPASAPVNFSVKRNAEYDWPTNGTVQVIDFSVDSTLWYNEGNGFDDKANYFQAPADGVYNFNGVIQFRNLTAGDQLYAEIQAGTKYYRGDQRYASGISDSARVNITVPLQAGDIVRLRAYVSAASPPGRVYGNSSTLYAFTYFNGARVD